MKPKSYGSASERGSKTMTLSIRPVIAVISLVFAAMGFPEAGAQALPDSRIAIVDFQLIQKNSTAMVDIQAQIEKRRLFYQEEISRQEKELRATDQELGRQRSVLSAETFALKRREFEAQVARVQREVQDRKRELDRAFEYGMKQVRLVINDIIGELSQQKNFNLVLSSQQIVFAENSLIISDDIIQILNQRLPLVEVPLTQN